MCVLLLFNITHNSTNYCCRYPHKPYQGLKVFLVSIASIRILIFFSPSSTFFFLLLIVSSSLSISFFSSNFSHFHCFLPSSPPPFHSPPPPTPLPPPPPPLPPPPSPPPPLSPRILPPCCPQTPQTTAFRGPTQTRQVFTASLPTPQPPRNNDALQPTFFPGDLPSLASLSLPAATLSPQTNTSHESNTQE